MLYDGDLVVKEIPCGRRKVKWSYDVVSDSENSWDLSRPMPSRVLLRYLTKGRTVTIVNEDRKIVNVLKDVNIVN